MLVIQHFKSVDYFRQKWKNGQGETLEIAKDDHNPFHWRLSLASLEGQSTFSDYKGYDRTLILVEGGPGELLVGDEKLFLKGMQAVRFSGDASASVSMVAPGRDFNLFCLRKKSKGNIYPTYISLNEQIQFPIAGKEHFLFCVSGKVEWNDRESEQSICLEPNDLLWFSRKQIKKEYLNQQLIGKAGQSVVLWIVLHAL